MKDLIKDFIGFFLIVFIFGVISAGTN